MHKCQKCGYCFRDSYDLKRHISRVKPCVKEEIFSATRSEQKEPLAEQKEPSTECEFCMNTFFNISTLIRHQKTCKLRNDPIRQLEIKHGITPILPDSKTECRFCNKGLSCTSKLNKHIIICKERDEYYQSLINKETKSHTINIQQNINIETMNITNNSGMCNFGNESLDEIDTENLIEEIYNILCNTETNNYILACKILTMFEEKMKENICNRNVKLRSLNSNYGEIKTNKGIIKVQIDKFLDNCIKNTAKNLNIKRKQIKTKDREIKKIFNHVDTYAVNGFKIPENPDEEEYLDEDSKNDLKDILNDKNLLKEVDQENFDYKYGIINNSFGNEVIKI
jgi:hypothetical protein